VIDIADVLKDPPSDALPFPNGEWGRQQWNKLQLWLGTRAGTRVSFRVAARGIRPWENADGTRDVYIDLPPVPVRIGEREYLFEIWTPGKPVRVGDETLRYNFPSVAYHAARSSGELDEWFRAPQNTSILVEGTVWTVNVNSLGNSICLSDVRISR